MAFYRKMPIANQTTGYHSNKKKHDVFINDKTQKTKEIERLQYEYARKQQHRKT